MKSKPPKIKLAQPRDVALGARIKQVREQARASQPFIAREIGVTFQQMQKYEYGHTRVSWSRLTEIADALDISIIELIAPLLDKNGRAKG